MKDLQEHLIRIHWMGTNDHTLLDNENLHLNFSASITSLPNLVFPVGPFGHAKFPV